MNATVTDLVAGSASTGRRVFISSVTLQETPSAADVGMLCAAADDLFRLGARWSRSSKRWMPSRRRWASRGPRPQRCGWRGGQGDGIEIAPHGCFRGPVTPPPNREARGRLGALHTTEATRGGRAAINRALKDARDAGFEISRL